MKKSSNPSKRPFAVDETIREMIRNLWDTHYIKEIAQILKISRTTVSKWGKKMGLGPANSKYGKPLRDPRSYTEFEARYVRENVDKKTSAEIAKMLGRSRFSVLCYCKKHKIKFLNSRKNELKKMPLDKIAWLKKNFAYCSNPFICSKLGISPSSLYRLKLKFNLTKSEEYMDDMNSRRGRKAYKTALKHGYGKQKGVIPEGLRPHVEARQKAKREREGRL